MVQILVLLLTLAISPLVAGSTLEGFDLQNYSKPVWNLPGLTGDEIRYTTYALNGATILGALLWVFAGYRLFRLVLFISGYTIGFFLTLTMLGTRPESALQGWLIYVFAFGGALVAGLLMVVLRAFGVVLFGFLTGGLFVTFLIGSTPVPNYLPYNWISLLLIGVFGLAFAGLTFWKEKVFLIIGTSFTGSFVVGTAISEIVWEKSAIDLLENIISQPLTNHFLFDASDWHFYAILGSIIGLTIVGLLIQWFLTARNYEHVKVQPQQNETSEYEQLTNLNDSGMY